MKRSYNEYRMMAAFDQLMRRYEYDGITVSMIAGACGLSRPVFYKYFESKQDLCARMIGCLFRDSLGDAEDFTWEELMGRYVRQLGEHMDLFHTVASLPLYRSAEISILRTLTDICFAMVRYRTGGRPEQELADVIRFYCSGTAYSFMGQIRRGIPPVPERLLRRVLLSEPEMLKELLADRYPAAVYDSAFPGVEKGGLARIRSHSEELSAAPGDQPAQIAW